MATKQYTNTGVSFPDPGLLAAAQAKAAAEDLTLSKYICRLIKADLGWPVGRYPAHQPQGVEMNEKSNEVKAAEEAAVKHMKDSAMKKRKAS